MPIKIMGVDHWRCPRRPIYEDPASFAYWLQAYRNYKNGILPEPGAFMQQAAIAVQVFNILDRAYNKVEQFHRDKQSRHGQDGGGGRRVSSRG